MARLNPSVAHHLDAHVLMDLLPHEDSRYLPDVRRALAQHIDRGRREQFTTWQDAWNDLTRAAPHREGQLCLRGVSCPTCSGRGFDTRHPGRSLSVTGSPFLCARCGGNRHSDVTLRARQALLPTPPPSA
jgi:hypothetical protein